jgi:hypothetical protein
LIFSRSISRSRWTQQIKNGHQLREVPPPLFIDALEVCVAQKTSAVRKANFPLGPRRSLIIFFSRSERGHRGDLRRPRGEHADKSVRATRSRDTIFAK